MRRFCSYLCLIVNVFAQLVRKYSRADRYDDPNMRFDISSVPLVRHDGKTNLQPCTESLITYLFEYEHVF